MAKLISGFEAELPTESGSLSYVSLEAIAERHGIRLELLPHTIRILLENIARRVGETAVSEQDVAQLAAWPHDPGDATVAFVPTRVLMQDFTGVPAVVDLAAMRSAMARAGADPTRVNPRIPVDLVIDHSVQVDRYGDAGAYEANIEWEYRRNAERYSLLNWAQQAFDDFRVIPPGMGICHQVNLEYLSQVISTKEGVVFPETLVGTDSHTTMINGLGVLGWGVGGIEAEASMLGLPMFLSWPKVVGVHVTGALPAGTTATDLVLTLTQMLRHHGVVGRFVEFFGSGLSALSVPDRATLANMSPEFGAFSALFPIDANTLLYLRDTGRDKASRLTEIYSKRQGLFRNDEDPDPVFTETLELDLASVEPSMAGPKRPQDRVALGDVPGSFASVFVAATRPQEIELNRLVAEGGNPKEEDPAAQVATESSDYPQPHIDPAPAEAVRTGSVVIAAITSCTNTSNPSVMIGAGLLAKKAVEAGLATKPWVKTSLAPGSRAVTAYLDRAGLLPYLEKLGFNLVGYGCTTCIGNSGPLPQEVADEIDERDLAVVAVLSGNRNFEGRIHPQVKASYLASPPLCVAYALAGRIDCDLTTQPLGHGSTGEPIYLRDVWPSGEEVQKVMTQSIGSGQFEKEYRNIFEGDSNWQSMPAPTGILFDWDPASTYVREPPYFEALSETYLHPGDIPDSRILVHLGDSVTTDHISPAGSIRPDSPAGQYLLENGVEKQDFNSYGARRGNHEVMLRGTFANPRLQNLLTPDKEGPWTYCFISEEVIPIEQAAYIYENENTPAIVVAGKEYGSGSSRDWAAKGPALLGVLAVIAESFERIHRSNLVGMGILPLEFEQGQSLSSLGLTGRESFSIAGIFPQISVGKKLRVLALREDHTDLRFDVTARIDNEAELSYFLHGGILPMVLRQMISAG